MREPGRRRLAVCALCLLALSACAVQPSKPEQPSGVPDLERVQQQAAEAYARSDWAQAEKSYKVLAEQVPQEVEPWFRLGNIYARTQRPDMAVAAYREVVIRDPGLAKAWHNMGVVQLTQAGNSFKEMQLYVDPSDPLYEVGQQILQTIARLLGQGEAFQDALQPAHGTLLVPAGHEESAP